MTILDRLQDAPCGCDAAEVTGGLLTIDEALGAIARLVRPVSGRETRELAAAKGRVLAAPLLARAPTPPFDNSAMDGYALAAGDLAGEGPWVLPVAGRAPAGDPTSRRLAPGSALRILTGAPLPAGADAVVMQEAVERRGDAILLRRAPAPGANIRRAGEDMAAGAAVLGAGLRLGLREIAAAAAAGAGTLEVLRPVRVALLVTGDEVTAPGAPLAHGAIWDVNTPVLQAALTRLGVELVALERGRDSRAGLTEQLARLAGAADLVVTSGGISVGDADHVKPALEAAGGEVVFAGVAIKPGKPVSAGRIGGTLWLGLPGNPLSAFTTWQVFGEPMLARLAGLAAPGTPRRHVTTAEALRHGPGRCEARLATLAGFDGTGREVVSCPDATRSGRVGGLPAADGLVLLGAGTGYLAPGSLLEFIPFRDS